MKLPLGARIALVVGVMLAALVAMVARHQWPLLYGREVVLATDPVDPRSLLRGDYVILTYRVSQLSSATLPLPAVADGDTVYVELRGPDHRGMWRAEAVTAERPEGSAPFLRGRVTGSWVDFDAGCGKAGCRVLSVDYGIESYFVPENSGRDLEDLVREGGRLAVAVAVDADGRAAIAGLVIDGQRVTREGLL